MTQRERFIKAFNFWYGVSEEDFLKIEEQNAYIKDFLSLEHALATTSSLENFKIINRFAFFRKDFNDISPLIKEDLDFVKREYNIDLELEKPKVHSFSEYDLLDLLEELEDIPEDLRISKLLKDAGVFKWVI